MKAIIKMKKEKEKDLFILNTVIYMKAILKIIIWKAKE